MQEIYKLWEILPGNATSDKIIFLLVAIIVIGYVIYLSKVFIWLFKKDSYWYYWRYWNPFTNTFNNRYTLNWFLRFLFSLPLLYAFVRKVLEINSSNYINSLKTSLIFFICFLLAYGVTTWLISREDGADSTLAIDEMKKKHNKSKD